MKEVGRFAERGGLVAASRRGSYSKVHSSDFFWLRSVLFLLSKSFFVLGNGAFWFFTNFWDLPPSPQTHVCLFLLHVAIGRVLRFRVGIVRLFHFSPRIFFKFSKLLEFVGRKWIDTKKFKHTSSGLAAFQGSSSSCRKRIFFPGLNPMKNLFST